MIQGDNVILKGLEPDDIKERHLWLNDPEITNYFTNLSSIHLSRNDLEKWYENISQKKSQEIHFSIFTKEPKHIGGAQLKSIDWKNRNAELGIFIGDKSKWGKGFGTDATKSLIFFGFNELNLHRIWLKVDPENLAALKCYQKTGFIQEGILREDVFRKGRFHDTIIMSILANQVLRKVNEK